jgi:hypothetical protein
VNYNYLRNLVLRYVMVYAREKELENNDTGAEGS